MSVQGLYTEHASLVSAMLMGEPYDEVRLDEIERMLDEHEMAGFFTSGYLTFGSWAISLHTKHIEGSAIVLLRVEPTPAPDEARRVRFDLGKRIFLDDVPSSVKCMASEVAEWVGKEWKR